MSQIWKKWDESLAVHKKVVPLQRHYIRTVMSTKEKEVLKKIREVAHHSIPKGGRALLYGSRARGNAHQGSDWDVLILLDKDKLDDWDYTHVSYPFVMLGSEINEEINPIMYTEKEWKQYNFTPFYENVEQDGVQL